MDAEHEYTPEQIARAIGQVIAATPTDWDHDLYIRRLVHAFQSYGFDVARAVRVPWRGTPDGRAGRLSLVLKGYAAIEVDGYTPHPRSYIKLMQAPKGCKALVIVLRLGSIPPNEWDSKYVPKSHPSHSPLTDTALHQSRNSLAIQSDIAVISAPMP